ncbi:MAG: ATP-dependent DNA helicase RecG [Candidatus Buchananbacteria bacterium]
MKLELSTPVSMLNRVGKTTAGRLKHLGLETVFDLIFYYPFRWQDFSQVVNIGELTPSEAVSVKGKIQLINSRRSFKTRTNLTEALIADQTGSVKAIWFNQPYLAKTLQPGDEIYLSGKVDENRYVMQFNNPVYEKVGYGQTTHTARLVPIYSLTSNLTEKQLRFLIKTALGAVGQIPEFLPAAVIKENHLLDLHTALQEIHFPRNKKFLDQAIRRLKFDELFLFQLQIIVNKNDLAALPAKPIEFNEIKTQEFVSHLPFQLTDDQKKCAWKIISDLSKNHPMNRLLEGEVGSGKTVVAALAILNAVLAGQQAALIAPTEILAAQHAKSLASLLALAKIEVCLFTRSQRFLGDSKEPKNDLLAGIKNGEIKVVVGTHAIIQDDVGFNNLGLVIIDEQHRFGVKQRQALKNKSGKNNNMPHLLSMTATPIPRSLALTLCGDLDLSIIRQLPRARKKIITKIVDSKNRQQAYDFIRAQINDGRQAFVICPLIDLSDKLGVKAVVDEFTKLDKEIFPEFKIAILHGKLKAEEKSRVMADFLARKIDILVATSVVEVGVDVPNASVMLIEGAQRFGLSQLHQFRGRVGRSLHQSYCFIFSEKPSLKTDQRLKALVEAKDGFELAEYDLKFRGPGEIYGTIQSGFPEFKIALLTDSQLMIEAKEAAQKLFDANLSLRDYPELKARLAQVMEKIHFE